jgi:signal transduction histidine kinase
MKEILRKRFVSILRQYPVLVAGLLIYGYYLATTMNFFSRSNSSQLSFLDFVLQFDSLIWMWITAFVFIKLQQVRDKHLHEEKARTTMETQIEKSAIASNMLKDITMQLQDTVNNPLAIISAMTDEIRKKYIIDPEVVRRLDQIDASLQRIHNAIKDITVYQTEQLLVSLQQNVSGKKQTE